MSSGPRPPKDSAPAPRTTGQVVALGSHAEGGSPDLFGIGDLCKEFGITQRTLRFYESKGLLCPRRINGTRVYTKQDRARLARILRAKSLGSPLSEIKQYLDMYGQHGEGRIQQLQFVIDKTAAAMEDLKVKRAQIDTTIAELQLINSTCRKTIEEKRRSRERQRSSH